jgi:hypothetical protein
MPFSSPNSVAGLPDKYPERLLADGPSTLQALLTQQSSSIDLPVAGLPNFLSTVSPLLLRSSSAHNILPMLCALDTVYFWQRLRDYSISMRLLWRL